MALHLITGYAGREHITSADQGAYNMATFGSGNFVLDRGSKFAYTVRSNNTIAIADGEAMIQGRFLKMPLGTSEELTISNGSQGKLRNDLICIRYTRSTTDNTEKAELIVLKGTEATSSPSDPSYINGNITDGNDTVTDFPLYRVSLNGISISTVTQLFTVKVSMTKYMNDYQMPTASKTQQGSMQVGNTLDVNNGVVNYNLPTASASQKGGVKVGNTLSMSGDTLNYNLPTASKTQKGGIKVGSFLAVSNETVSVNLDSAGGEDKSSRVKFTVPANGMVKITAFVREGKQLVTDEIISPVVYEINEGGNMLIPQIKSYGVTSYDGGINYGAYVEIEVYNPTSVALAINRVYVQFMYLR